MPPPSPHSQCFRIETNGKFTITTIGTAMPDGKRALADHYWKLSIGKKKVNATLTNEKNDQGRLDPNAVATLLFQPIFDANPQLTAYDSPCGPVLLWPANADNFEEMRDEWMVSANMGLALDFEQEIRCKTSTTDLHDVCHPFDAVAGLLHVATAQTIQDVLAEAASGLHDVKAGFKLAKLHRPQVPSRVAAHKVSLALCATARAAHNSPVENVRIDNGEVRIENRAGAVVTELSFHRARR
eukprot:m.91463 g.91463  ORF g.91463 m.91463 type:complete len:241 (+) comp11938_c0_seq2:359-1081(+)